MNYNITNGGLICKTGQKLLMTSLYDYETFYMSAAAGLLWFMNDGGEYIYCSDQKQANGLCRMDTATGIVECILDKPSYGVVLHAGWLYYINEEDGRLYRCQTDGRSEMRILDEQILSFILEQDIVFYSTEKGIWTCSESGRDKEKISDTAAPLLVKVNEKLAYPNKDKKHVLTLLDLKSAAVEIIDDVAAMSMNTDGRYLYCANLMHDKSIYRVDPEWGNSIRICGESADFLHIIDDELYFCSQKEWHKMPVTGGQYRKVLRDVDAQ